MWKSIVYLPAFLVCSSSSIKQPSYLSVASIACIHLIIWAECWQDGAYCNRLCWPLFILPKKYCGLQWLGGDVELCHIDRTPVESVSNESASNSACSIWSPKRISLYLYDHLIEKANMSLLQHSMTNWYLEQGSSSARCDNYATNNGLFIVQHFPLS